MRNKMKKISFIIFSILLVVNAEAALKVYPAGEGMATLNDYTVSVRQLPEGDWQTVDVYPVRVDEVIDAKHNARVASMAYFDFEGEVEVSVEAPKNERYLFTTKTCPNCRLAKEYLEDVSYVVIDAEENIELANRYGVMQAPTLVVVDGDKHKKYVNASNIKKYVESLKEVLLH